MRFKVVRVRERGVLLPRRALLCAPTVVGDLRVIEERDDLLARTLLRACVVNAADARIHDLIPRLWEPRLLWMGPEGFTLGGYERLPGPGDPIEYAQTWWVRTL